MAQLALETQKLSNMNAFRNAMHQATVNPIWKRSNQAHQQRWNPYSMEGGWVKCKKDTFQPLLLVLEALAPLLDQTLLSLEQTLVCRMLKWALCTVKRTSCIHCEFLKKDLDEVYLQIFRNDNIILATGGFCGDAIQLRRVLHVSQVDLETFNTTKILVSSSQVPFRLPLWHDCWFVCWNVGS